MVRQKSGEMASPTPSIDSLNGAGVGSLCGDQVNDHSSVESGLGGNSTSSHVYGGSSTGPSSMAEHMGSSTSSAASPSSSGLGSSPLGQPSVFASGTLSVSASSSSSSKCLVCHGSLSQPKVLLCLHTFCQSCLERIQDHPEKISCPSCHADTPLRNGGVAGLLSDFGVPALTDGGSFISLGNNNTEGASQRLGNHFVKTQKEINEAFQYYANAMEERKAEILRDLEAVHSSRQAGVALYTEKSQETVEKIYQLNDFIERLVKHASSGEVLLFKRPIEQKFAAILAPLSKYDSNLDHLIDFEFASNPNAVPSAIKNTFGFIRIRSESSGELPNNRMLSNLGKQPPISRPVSQAPGHGSPSSSSSSSSSSSGSHHTLGLSPLLGNVSGAGNVLSNGLAQGIATLAAASSNNNATNLINGMHLNGNSLKNLLERQQQQIPASVSATAGGYPYANSNGGVNSGASSCSSLLDTDSLLAKRFNRAMGPLVSGNSSLSDLSNGLGGHSNNPYEKWSNGSDNLLFNGSVCSNDSQTATHYAALSSAVAAAAAAAGSSSLGGGAPGGPSNDHFMDLTSKIMGSPHANTSLFPPKSQIKRQKMIYHCKFGEFGVLEGQFTEPSGVAVNAQNDIIVADTNNHRIQIFDKEGRFKFQFGECGKRDGQLLYPNRVAVVRQSGDIIVTERSPTHQVQIYNQYGQFVRKFGANILQHPRGVCVDHKGRIIVVECKVMRVIIFDQMGNVLSKFGCSKHLEFPNGVVVNDRQEIFISDNRAHCVKVFNYEGTYLRQIGGEGITNYPIGVGINAAGEVTIADNHNNFNLSVFSQDGQLLSALESKVKHAQCFDVSLMDDGYVAHLHNQLPIYPLTFPINTIELLEQHPSGHSPFEPSANDSASALGGLLRWSLNETQGISVTLQCTVQVNDPVPVPPGPVCFSTSIISIIVVVRAIPVSPGNESESKPKWCW
ncbi:hypothetical protein TCAL_12803 [Tigriopus californicus]|uniref:RING-type domain-containing protein n=1 Tax=Tigriopus californicus TaxID=6832 RepID=A0A553P820_TIGCA|nr:hypothetical protein TCAL_12803 [Tigriopus californicus]